MPKRKPELHAVTTEPAPRVWFAPLESEELLERAAALFPGTDYLPLAWISAVTYLRKQSRCGWVCDRFVSKASAPPA